MKALVLASLASVLSIVATMLLTPMLDVDFGEPAELARQVGDMFMVLLVLLAIVGWPIYFILMRLTWLNAVTIGLAGFAMGVLPGTLASFIARAYRGSTYSGTWHGRDVHFIVDNQLTMYGWLSYAEITLVAGLHGLLGALVFHYVWRHIAGVAPSPET